ncbi:division/cell wall cluster transcriptional repressor MraZ [Bacteroides sp. 519]|uniref:division/cell wall cluster transcriptional repressor MraZ n=1 Tax=Bacteroides sp. 519 TaxID=2302937 RepID=UPI0013D401CC|nr:division/cell wall cluster transcriptional repressor MraZ [Bacteroides sp. 519]NDV57337.1 division/cell wall cluster transcriptional repressor MraZ [Bacteroides sp. 519]
MSHFIGSIEAKADAKGRLFIPAQFRKQLQMLGEERLIMKKDVFQKCLTLYPESEWNKDLNELQAKLNKWNAKHQLILRQFVSDVEIIVPDSNGRILIPKRYLQMAEIEADVIFMGVSTKIEIWAKGKEKDSFLEPEMFGAELEEIMKSDISFTPN